MTAYSEYCSAIAFIAVCGSVCFAAEPDGVAMYQAEYEVQYNGRRVAEAVFEVTSSAPGEYAFASSTRARGLLRLASPKPVIELSRFAIDSGQLSPVTFEYEDGSRKGEDNFSIAFDEASHEIQVSASTGISALPFESDLLDRGSLQVALTRDVARCAMPGPYRYVDDDGVKTYYYERIEDLAAETGIGALDTVRFVQQRDGSSRRTILWLAREYAYLPVRIEQIRDGEIETVFLLESLSGISRSESECSSFR